MLRAARTVFAERGYKHATVDEIAHRSEFAKGTIYNYFPNGKDEILFAILDDVYDEVYDLSVEAFEGPEGSSFAEALRRYVESTLAYFLREQDLFVIIMKEANRLAFGDDPSKATYFKDQFHRIISVLEPQIERAIENGELRSYGGHAVAHMILGNVHGYLRYHCLQKIGEQGVEDCEPLTAAEAAAFLSGMLLHGLARTDGSRSGQSDEVERAVELEIDK
jgi:AcrR family transcriptional regulator